MYSNGIPCIIALPLAALKRDIKVGKMAAELFLHHSIAAGGIETFDTSNGNQERHVNLHHSIAACGIETLNVKKILFDRLTCIIALPLAALKP